MRHQLLAIGFILLLCGTTLVPIHITGEENVNRTIYVDDDNTDGPWDGSREHPYQCIQDGIDNASDGDTVFVYSGTYDERWLIIEKAIMLEGENQDTTIIMAGGWYGIYLDHDSIIVTKFTIKGSIDRGYHNGIFISSDYNIILNNTIEITHMAIMIGWANHHNTIKNNTIKNNYFGIRIEGSDNTMLCL